MKPALLFVLAALALRAQNDDSPWRRMEESKRQMTEYLVRRGREVTDRAAAEIRSVQSWEAVRAKRREEMRDMLGLLPWPERTPMNARIAGVVDQGSCTVEKLVFESLPKIYVTANLYVPKRREGRRPAIVYVCGHSYSPFGDKTQYQRHGISFAKNGYLALVLDSIQIAETFALHHGVQSQEMYDWYARGYTPAGVEVWNAIRAIDYLETRPEVDRARIGMTGRSGGAAMSWFTAAVEPRIKVVAPVMGISTYSANMRENTQRLHCDCMFAINTYQHDMLHQGALIAPRPLLMAHGRKDALFPVEGYKEFEARIGELYRGYGRGEAFKNIEVDTAHQDSDYLREQAIRWFDRFFLDAPERQLDMSYTNLPEEQLAVFGGKPPEDAQNFRVHEIFTARRPGGPLLEELRAKVFRALRPVGSPATASVGRAEGFQELRIAPTAGVPLRALLRRPSKQSAPGPALLYVASDGEDPRAIQDLLRGRGNFVSLVIYPRGVGEVPWDKTFWKATLRNAMQLGETVDSMRLFDVLAAAEVLRGQPGVDPARLMTLGKGISGALGLYAAILDPRISQAMLMEPPVSHAQGPIFLNILRYTDLPEAAALLAPRHLAFYGHMPAEFERLSANVSTSMSIEAVLEGRYDHGFASGN